MPFSMSWDCVRAPKPECLMTSAPGAPAGLQHLTSSCGPVRARAVAHSTTPAARQLQGLGLYAAARSAPATGKALTGMRQRLALPISSYSCCC